MAPNPLSSIQREIRQKRPFASKGQEAAVALLRTADVVRRRSARLLEPHGITPQQYNVLRILRGAADDGLQTLEIAGRMIEQTPGITRLLDRLEAKALVSRERNAEDRRCVVCRITPAGLALLARLDAPVLQTAHALFRSLAEADIDRLLSLLESVRSSSG